MQEATILAICALFVSAVSLFTSVYFSWCARDHNRRSVKPLPFIAQRDFEDQIAVIIRNNGTGPMILQKVLASSPEGRSGHLIDLVPTPPPGMLFQNFNKIHQVRAIRPGDEVELLVLPVDINNAPATGYRDTLRLALGTMTVELTYTDIYETKFPVYALKMIWFHRHF
jgi:hypothetical protein